MAPKPEPKTGLAEALFVIFLTFFGELLCIFIPFIGSLVSVLICEAYVFFRGLPYVASLVAGAIDVLSSSWSFAMTIGMITVFIADHNPKLGQVAAVASRVTLKGGALKSAEGAAAKSVAAGTSSSSPTRRERWFTERGGAAPERPGPVSTPATAPGTTTGTSGGLEPTTPTAGASNTSQAPTARSSRPSSTGRGRTNQGQTLETKEESTQKSEGDRIFDEAFGDTQEEKLLQSLEEGVTEESIKNDDPLRLYLNRSKNKNNHSGGKNTADVVKLDQAKKQPPGTRPAPENDKQLDKAA